MPIDYKNYAADWKTKIRPAIMQRAENQCENCGLKNYAVGFRTKSGAFHATAGNAHHDAAGNGELDYKDAKALVDHLNDFEKEWATDYYGEEGSYIVVVLTIAHLDHNTKNNAEDNLKALCQRCHNRHDTEHRKKTRKAKKVPMEWQIPADSLKNQLNLFENL